MGHIDPLIDRWETLSATVSVQTPRDDPMLIGVVETRHSVVQASKAGRAHYYGAMVLGYANLGVLTGIAHEVIYENASRIAAVPSIIGCMAAFYDMYLNQDLRHRR